MNHFSRLVLPLLLITVSGCSTVSNLVSSIKDSTNKNTTGGVLTGPQSVNLPSQTPIAGHAIFVDGTPVDSSRVVRTMYENNLDNVRLERSETASNNNHPIKLRPEDVTAILSSLTDNSGELLFLPDEIETLARPLANGLAIATPNQDLTFAVTGRHGALGLVSRKQVTTGRVFYDDKGFNIIIGIEYGEYEGMLQGSGVLRPFTPGMRARPVESTTSIKVLSSVKGELLRQDWAVIAVSLPDATATPVTPKAINVTGVPQAPTSAPRAAPILIPAGSATAPVTESAAAQPPSRAVDRLRALEQAKKEGLITEQEYQQKRKAVIDSL